MTIMGMTDNSQTAAVIAQHIQALEAGNVDTILKNFTEQSVLIANLAPAPAQGLDAIRAQFTEAVKLFTPGVDKSFKITQQEVQNQFGYIVWSAPPTIQSATDTFVVREDGKILFQTSTIFLGQAARPS